jgi:hypothetical protein
VGKFLRIAFTMSITFVLVFNNVLPLWSDILIILAGIGTNISEMRAKIPSAIKG